MLCIYADLSGGCYYYAVAVLSALLVKGYLCTYILCVIKSYEVGGSAVQVLWAVVRRVGERMGLFMYVLCRVV
jgi:hypothetical protein